MPKCKLRTWIVDLGSLVVEAYTSEEAVEKAQEGVQKGYVEIDRVIVEDADLLFGENIDEHKSCWQQVDGGNSHRHSRIPSRREASASVEEGGRDAA